MSGCDNSNIRKNYIVTGSEQEILSACTAIYTNNIYPCESNDININSSTLNANNINADNINLSGLLTACEGIYTSNIYGCSPITIKDQLILEIVTNNNLLDKLLVIDNNGLVEYRDISSLVVTGSGISNFVYDDKNTFVITRSDSISFSATINTVTGLTLNNLTPGRVVYVGTGGELTDESGFEYNDSTDLLTVGNIFVNNPSGTTANIGQGGLVIGSGGSSSTPGIGDLVVHGDLTVFGDTTTISTSELYIEDPQITLNYNPTGDTSVTSIGSGILIQDGGGVAGQDVKIGVGQLFGSSISGDTSEYTSTTGFENRGWVTQLNDIVIRNSSPVNFGDPDGVRVLGEFDVLDGGQY